MPAHRSASRSIASVVIPPVVHGLTAIALIAIATSASLAFAEEGEGGNAPDYTTPGFYLYFGGATGIDVAAADELNEILADVGVPPVVDVGTAIGFNARIGARAARWLATEAQVEYLPSFDVALGPVSVASYRVVTVTGNLKLVVARGRFQPYLLVGGGGVFAEFETDLVPGLSGSASGFAVRGGGGFELYFTPHVALVVDASYVYPVEDVAGLDYVSIGWGLQYKF